ncbi:calcineurin-like phosphoesterase family protein [Chitinophaga pendula]|uniref:calcineurin-like phosphoesterase C-terminal domain-containing protein n=1 Tax=Chitinophaga TaxID=79328 RepID=UPI000BB07DAF|nr:MULTISPECIES: calcineurin-like phosphoesterase family protein [Chitinophaga]ASZ11274.1 metallophosphoesterase [Chitinophaga sp. MD30]UCJ05726.1 calcineurin-like phosphoesterase family protein [Chitinophaga pendula]
MNRRIFVRTVSLLVAGAMTGLRKVAGAMHIRAKAVKVNGRVTAAGKPVKGALISDGVNIVKTDNQGKYTLTTDADAEFVWISVPAGFAFPHHNGIADFYRRINQEKNEQAIDFKLDRLSRDDRKHQFALWADPQIKYDEDARELINVSAPDLKAVIESYGKDALFHGVGCGDLVWDEPRLFPDYNKAVAIAGIPFFQVIGNHDIDYNVDDSQSDRTFKSHYGPTYYSFNRGNAHYIVIDDVYYEGEDKKYKGFITDKQMAWLEKDLALVKPGSLVIVNIHIPSYTEMHIRNKKENPAPGGTVSNREKLYALLAPFNTHILSGHTHYNENIVNGNIMEHVHGTVCGAWWTGPVCSDGTPNGYGIYEVEGNDLKWYYKSTGKSRDYQLSIYSIALDGKAANAIMANVWNWDPQWKVELIADNTNIGEMKQHTGLDPQAVILYQGKDIPAKHKFVEPTATSHLFLGNVPAGTKKATVKVTDRFGQVYTQSIALDA